MSKKKDRYQQYERDDSLTVHEKQLKDRVLIQRLLKKDRPITHLDVMRMLNKFDDLQRTGYVK